ncbi:3-methyladenine DNA glycosylase [Arthrobacter sp. TMN-50]
MSSLSTSATTSARPDTLTVLRREQWLDAAASHRARVEPFARPYLERRSAGLKHPVEDFLFTYYTQKPGQLSRWHPGAGVVLTGPEAAERTDWKHYRTLTGAERTELALEKDVAAVTADVDAFRRDRAEALHFAAIIVRRTQARRAQLGCFGLHEWAMAYRSQVNGVRHEYLELRLGAEGTDQLVEDSKISCTHFDAFRFYTPQAVPLNALQPTRVTQRDLEQPGCLHANMDLYKWAYKLTPLLPSALVMDCFELAWRIRAMDMRASPYDLDAWGYGPIRVETPRGRSEYARLQRGFSDESQHLRQRLGTALANVELTGNGSALS